MISWNKKYSNKSINYKTRSNVIQWFEKYHPNEFDLYGPNWDEFVFPWDVHFLRRMNTPRFINLRKKFGKKYSTWKGSVTDKVKCINNYKFVFVFENTELIDGYITEKIFDVFYGGSIPIYSGPTHYSTEDFASLRSLPNCSIYTCSDSVSAKMVAKETIKIKTPVFVRLDRKASRNFSSKLTVKDINKGFRYLNKSSNSKNLIISQGTIIERPLAALNQVKLNKSNQFDVIDLIRAKPFPRELKNILSKYKSIITIDEQTSTGSLESLIKENILKNINILPMSLPDQFIFENMGRDKLLDKYGLSIDKIKKNIYKIIK